VHNSLFQIQTLTGRPLSVADMQVYVCSQVVQVRLPFGYGKILWNRPLSVLLRRSNGQEQILPVPDVTRTAVLTLLAFSLVSGFLWMRFRFMNDES